MTAPPIPFNEAARQAVLEAYGILDTLPDQRFDRITRLAKQLFGTAFALVSLIDGDRQWFKSVDGLDACETPRDVSFCAHAILHEDVFVVLDARLDPRFRDNPLVTGEPHIRFYAGAPLVTDDGFALGTLCIIDREARAHFGPEDRAQLADLAAVVMDEMELHRALHESRDHASRVAGAAGRAKREFLAMANHELRTPLNAIIGNAEMLEHQLFGPVGSDRYTDVATDILSSARHLEGLVARILLMSRIESGELVLERSETDTHSLVDRALPLCREAAEKRGVRLDVRHEGAPIGVHVDGEQMTQALAHLIDNAVKFSEGGGAVSVTTELTRDGAPRLSVTDDGVGISQDQIAAAFGVFDQADGRLARLYDGAGLGLPIAKRLVELHGGSLAIESSVGSGTTATIALPRHCLLDKGPSREGAGSDGSAVAAAD